MDRTGPRRRTGHWKGTLEDNLPLEGWVVRHCYSLDTEDEEWVAGDWGYPLCEMCLFQRPRHRFVMVHADVPDPVEAGCECCVHMIEGDRALADTALAAMKKRAHRVDALAQLFHRVDDPLWDDLRVWECEGIAFEVYRLGDAWTASARHASPDYVMWRRGGHRSRFEALAAIREECLTPTGRRPEGWLIARMAGLTAKKGLPRLRVEGRTLLVVEDGRLFKLIHPKDRGGWMTLAAGMRSSGQALRRASSLLGWT